MVLEPHERLMERVDLRALHLCFDPIAGDYFILRWLRLKQASCLLRLEAEGLGSLQSTRDNLFNLL